MCIRDSICVHDYLGIKQNNDFNKRFDDNDIKFDVQNNKFKELNKRFDSNEITLNEVKSDFNSKLDEQRIKCEQQNIQLQQSISVQFDELINDIQEKNKRNSLNKLEQSKSCLLYTSRCV